MKRSRAAVRRWTFVLAAMAVIVNWPHNAGTLKPWIWNAGFPMMYAGWQGTRLVEWHPHALLINILVWLLAFVAILVRSALRPQRARTSART